VDGVDGSPIRAVLASANPHKLEELRAALPGWELELLGAADYPPEDGASYHEIARGKALFGRARAPAGAWVLGEDSGIEAAALGGAQGIASARWAGDGVARLLEELAAADDRRVRYVCELVALSPAGEEVSARGVLEGTATRERRGSEGFGYDPVVVPEGETKTVAELGNAWKARNSHRARAARGLREALAT
jgi:XTP/dITP diphosphohydrolase